MNTQKKHWQITPSDFIAHAIEHANKNTDFDKQMAFLLLDIGVENALKTFLKKEHYREFEKLKKESAKEISFFAIVTAVKRLTSEKMPEFDPERILGFHEQRNDLYHNENRLNPPDDDLRSYIEIAKKILKVLLDIDIDKLQDKLQKDADKSQEQPLDKTNHSKTSLIKRIEKSIASLQYNSSLIVEHIYPQIATRKVESQLRYIRNETGPDDESCPPLVRVEFRQQRIDAFNKITGWNFSYDEYDMNDYEFVEYIIDNPEQLYVWLAFQEISNNDWSEGWEEYKKIISFSKYEESKRYKWIHEKAKIVYQWIKTHIPNVEPIDPDNGLPVLLDF